MQPGFKTETAMTEADFRYLYRTNLIRTQGIKGGAILLVVAVLVAVIAGIIAKNAEKSPTFAIVLALIVIAAFSAMILKNLSGEIKRIAAGQITAHQEKYPGTPYIIVNEVFEDRILTGLKTEGTEKTEISREDIGKIIVTKQAVICTTKTTGQSLFFKKDSFTEGNFEDFIRFLAKK